MNGNMNKPQDGMVRIYAGPTMAGVSPPHETLLAPLLTCPGSSFEPGGPLGHQRVKQVHEFYYIDDDTLHFPLNMLAQVEATLRQAGFQVEVGPSPQVNCHFPVDRDLLNSVSYDEKRMLEAVLGHRAGIIEIDRPNDPAHTIGLICRLWPMARILIPVPTQNQVSALFEQLRPILGDQVQTFKTWKWNSAHRCLICSLKLADCANELDWHVVLHPNPLPAVAKSHEPGCATFVNRRHYGFLPRGTVLDKRMALTLGPFFGDCIYRALDPRGHAANVEIIWLTAPWSPRSGTYDALERKRRHLWNNDVRNDYVAAVARAVGAADPAALAKLGFPLDHHIIRADGIKPRTTILVESTAHGQELVRRLPGWKLWSMTPADRQRREHDAEQMWDCCDARRLDQKILTLLVASQIKTLTTDVLIRADGASGPLNLPGFPPRMSQPGSEVTLIDLADDFDSAAVAATRQRQAGYADQGWTVLTAPRWVLDPESPVPGVAGDPVGQRRSRRHRLG